MGGWVVCFVLRVTDTLWRQVLYLSPRGKQGTGRGAARRAKYARRRTQPVHPFSSRVPTATVPAWDGARQKRKPSSSRLCP